MDVDPPRTALAPPDMWEFVWLVVEWLELTPPFTISQFHHALAREMECSITLHPLLSGTKWRLRVVPLDRRGLCGQLPAHTQPGASVAHDLSRIRPYRAQPCRSESPDNAAVS